MLTAMLYTLMVPLMTFTPQSVTKNEKLLARSVIMS